jgi:competence protein ComEA
MRRVVIVVCAALLFLPVAMKSRTSQEVTARPAFQVLSSGRVHIKVSGEVSHPGLYEMPANSLAISAIILAVPLRPLNKYMIIPEDGPLMNGSTVNVAVNSDGSHLIMQGHMTVAERMVLKIPLDIATMSEADFDRLPGIGPALAKRITEYRQNNGGILRVEDLAAIDGIGEKKYKRYRTYFQPP